MVDWHEFLLDLAAYGSLAGLGGLVCLLLRRYAPGGRSRLLPIAGQPRGDWSGREVFLTFFIYLVVAEVFAPSLLYSLGFFERLYGEEPSPERLGMWSMLLAVPLVVALVIWSLYQASGTRPADLGLSPVRMAANIQVGYLGFLVLSPLVFVIYTLVLPFLARREDPLEVVLKDAMPVEWAVVFFDVMIGAAVTEELVFRGVLQGWLIRAPRLGHGAVAGATILAAHRGWLRYLGDQQDKVPHPGWEPTVFVVLLVVAYLLLIRQAFSRQDKALAYIQNHPFLGLWGTSGLFAMFHPTWPAPIALFVLSLGLGWLAYRTRSLVGPMVLHGMFNGVSSLALLFKVM